MRCIMVNLAIDALRAGKLLQWVGENEEMLDVLSAPVHPDGEDGPEWPG